MCVSLLLLWLLLWLLPWLLCLLLVVLVLLQVGSCETSPNQLLLAWTEDTVGGEKYTLHVKVRGGVGVGVCPCRGGGCCLYGGVGWAGGGAGREEREGEGGQGRGGRGGLHNGGGGVLVFVAVVV